MSDEAQRLAEFGQRHGLEVVPHPALQELTPQHRQKALSILQAATKDGGVHVVETSSDGVRLVPLEELEASYYGWQTIVEGSLSNETFSARKAVA